MKTENELIAEFMGAHVIASSTTLDGKRTSCTLEYFFNKKIYSCRIVNGNEYQDIFQFNTSWDWLMPVVEKIEIIGGRIFIEPDCVELWLSDTNRTERTFNIDPQNYEHPFDKIEAVYMAVVEFIKWYNEQV